MLPSEIWYLILDELEAHEDGAALFNLAQANRTLASMAFPRLYRICIEVVESQWEFQDRNAARLWRSIFLSAEDKTVFPYCLWIKTLSFRFLSDVLSALECWGDGPCSLFSFGHMAQCDILKKVGETIISFIEKATERGEHAVSLVCLEVAEDTPDMIPTWVARLPTLEKLQVSGPSALSIEEVSGPLALSTEVASAIRDRCPRFRHLAIDTDYIPTQEVLASFLRKLRPGCLEVFSAVGNDDVSDKALGALAATHATSLRRLELMVSPMAKDDFYNPHPCVSLHLGALRPCVSLERLDLYELGLDYDTDDAREGALRLCQRRRVNRHPEFDDDEAPSSVYFVPSWSTAHETSFANTAAWLGSCASLVSLALFGIPDCGELLRTVLQSPSLRLRYLHVDAPACTTEMGEACFLESLHHQTALEGFTFGWRYSGLDFPGSPTHQLLMRSLCQCPQLRALKLIDTALTPSNLARLATSLPNLEVLMFDSDTEALEDTAFESLLAMPKLKRLCIDSPTRFTMEGMFDYIKAVAAQGRRTRVAFGYHNTSEEDRKRLLEHAQSLGVDFEVLSG